MPPHILGSLTYHIRETLTLHIRGNMTGDNRANMRGESVGDMIFVQHPMRIHREVVSMRYLIIICLIYLVNNLPGILIK